MGQLNLRVNADFEDKLTRLMRLRGIPSRSEAVRLAVAEALERSAGDQLRTDFGAWRGKAVGTRPRSQWRVQSDDDLWERPR